VSVSLPVRLRTLETEVTQLHGRPRALTADERAVLADGAREIVALIRARWPRDTGFSAARWTATISGQRGDYGITVSNDASYVQYVHPKGDDTPLWSTLVPAVIRAVEPALRAAVVKEAEKTEARVEREARRRQQPARPTFLDLMRNRQGVPRGA